MIAENMSTSFKQYSFCATCHRNHNNGKRHVYSKKHREILHNLLQKFAKKIASAKNNMKSPVIKPVIWELGAKFWCYFCSSEYTKHKLTNNVVIENYGLLEHLKDIKHLQNMKTFWWKNKMDKTKQIYYFILSDDFEKFKMLSEEAVNKYVEDHKKVLRNGAVQIQSREDWRQEFFSQESQKVCFQYLNCVSSDNHK